MEHPLAYITSDLYTLKIGGNILTLEIKEVLSSEVK